MAFSDRIFRTIVGESLNDEDDPLRWWYMVYQDKNKKFAGAFIIEAREEKLMGPYDRMKELKLEPANSTVRQKIEIPDETWAECGEYIATECSAPKRFGASGRSSSRRNGEGVVSAFAQLPIFPVVCYKESPRPSGHCGVRPKTA